MQFNAYQWRTYRRLRSREVERGWWGSYRWTWAGNRSPVRRRNPWPCQWHQSRPARQGPGQKKTSSSVVVAHVSFLEDYGSHHGLCNYTDTKAKCRQAKMLTCIGILRQGFIRVDGLEIQSVMYIGIFDPALWTVGRCPSNLLSGSTLPPSPFPLWIVYCIHLYRV